MSSNESSFLDDNLENNEIEFSALSYQQGTSNNDQNHLELSLQPVTCNRMRRDIFGG